MTTHYLPADIQAALDATFAAEEWRQPTLGAPFLTDVDFNTLGVNNLHDAAWQHNAAMSRAQAAVEAIIDNLLSVREYGA